MRLFVALDVPAEVKVYLDEVVNELDQRLPRRVLRWVKPHTIHLTLAFLGETSAEKIAPVVDTLTTVGAKHDPLRLALSHIGYFPNHRRPRTVWAGLQGDVEQLIQLKQAIDLALDPLGWPAEKRRFTPHLTLGRVKDKQKLQMGMLPKSRRLEGMGWESAEIQLVRSQLLSSGPIYTTIRTVPLRRPTIQQSM